MEWMKTYENLTEKEKEDFALTVNRLLAQTYLVYYNDDDTRLYRFVERYHELIKEYMHIGGWKVSLHRDFRIVSVSSALDKNRLHLTIEETMFLYILRLLYDEKLKELTLAPQITVTIQELQDNYVSLQISKRLPTKDTMKKTLRIFEKHSLIKLVQGNYDNPESILIIYPTVTIATTIQAIEEFSTKLLEKSKSKGDVDIEEIDESEVY
ncbi:DUF4194 domain-containing protein [Paenibacillus sp. Marseille-Q4541]|uniref:DUF4194 domain-containing protein n=1 Tax=Paenibacillus sp. Marseille-Q4541 TaxID=2831522 RepID=UPI001BAD6916|nr:DUF4194 domain-containing protein [Paenibacillus sp. Marseille-Q4541]